MTAYALRRDGLVTGALRGSSWVRERFPPQTYGVALAGTFASSYLLYTAMTGEIALPATALPGAGAFVLLFLVLRLVDDIEDAARDARAGGLDAEAVGARRARMGAGVVAATLACVLLSRGAASRGVAVAAVGGMLFTTFLLKPLLSRGAPVDLPTTGSAWKDALLAVFFEGVHFLLFLYVYCTWSDVTGGSLNALPVVAVTGAYWAMYEFWKYSRYSTRPGWRPYGLTWTGARRGLVGVLAVGFACHLAICALADLPRVFALHPVAVALGFTAWLACVSPDRKSSPGAPRVHGLMGMMHVAAVNAGAFAAVLWLLRSPS